MSAQEPEPRARTLAPASRLEIDLLGRFAVCVGPRAIRDAQWRRKARGLLQLLALSPGHRLHREQVMECLWPEAKDSAKALNNLNGTLHAARHVLQPDAPPRSPSAYVALSGETLILCPAGNLWVDVDAFTATATAARRTRDLAYFGRALDLYAGELLPDDPFEDWMRSRREQLHRLYVAVLSDTVAAHLQTGDRDEAIRLLERLVGAQPDDEETHVRLMRLYAASGQRYAALTQYQQLRTILGELDLEPRPETQRLYAEIQSAGLQASAAGYELDQEERTGSSSSESHLANIASGDAGEPIHPSLSSFVGRVSEIEELMRLLRHTRLLTVTGAGGCGKSRLVLEAAARVRDRYRDGVVVVDLASVVDPRRVPQAVAQALGVTEEAGRPITETLRQALRGKHLLLLLDNGAHVRDACAELVETLLATCRDLRVLVTSRRPLRLAQEYRWRIPSLATPTPDHLPPFDRLLDYDAVRLFCERAAAWNPNFALTPNQADLVVEICARFDGIPLAIELAASRRRYMRIDQIAARLDDALQMTAPTAGQHPRRHQTLRAALDWSYSLLPEPERCLFQRLAGFVGGWTLEAAEAICAQSPSDPRSEPLAVADLLGQLVEDSLVGVEERGETIRYRYLEPVRQYAYRKLVESGEAEAVLRRHAEWYCHLAGGGDGQFRSMERDDQCVWLHAVDAEQANLCAALTWAHDHEQAETGLRLAIALEPYWYRRGLLSEGRRWLDELLALPVNIDARLRATTVHTASVLALFQADLEAATRLAHEGVVLCQEVGDGIGLGRALTVLGGAAEFAGEYASAAQYYEQCLAFARRIDDVPRVIISLSNLADVLTARADPGDLKRADQLYQDCRILASRHNQPRLVGMALTNLGKLALLRGEVDLALQQLEEALQLMRGLEEARGIAEVLLPLGRMALARGDLRGALTRSTEALDRYQQAGMQVGIAQGLEAIAQIAVKGYAWEWAAQLVGAADVLRERGKLPPTCLERAQIEQTHECLRSQLSGEAFAAAWAEGRTLPIAQIVAGAVARARVWPRSTGLTAGRRRAPRKRSSSANGLTLRQWEVAELVAERLTNQAIATRLGLSERTIHTHVHDSLTALDLDSRAELAAWVIQQKVGQRAGQKVGQKTARRGKGTG